MNLGGIVCLDGQQGGRHHHLSIDVTDEVVRRHESATGFAAGGDDDRIRAARYVCIRWRTGAGHGDAGDGVRILECS